MRGPAIIHENLNDTGLLAKMMTGDEVGATMTDILRGEKSSDLLATRAWMKSAITGQTAETGTVDVALQELLRTLLLDQDAWMIMAIDDDHGLQEPVADLLNQHPT